MKTRRGSEHKSEMGGGVELPKSLPFTNGVVLSTYSYNGISAESKLVIGRTDPNQIMATDYQNSFSPRKISDDISGAAVGGGIYQPVQL